MPRLLDRRHEHVAQLLFTGKSAEDASLGAGYPSGTSFASGARKRANRKDIKGRVAELQDRAAQAAEIDKTFILLELRNRLEFNIDDYLTPGGVGKWGEPLHRRLELDAVPRHILARIRKLRGGKHPSIEGADPVAILGQMAKVAGIVDREEADALANIGDRLTEAVKRLARMGRPSFQGRLLLEQQRADQDAPPEPPAAG